MQIWPRASFHLTPSETWVGSRNTFLNLTWPDLEDFSVITPLGRVDSHARREVEGRSSRSCYESWCETNRGPCLEQKSGEERESAGTEKEVNNMSDRKEWKGGKWSDVRNVTCKRPILEHQSCPSVSSTSTTSPLLSLSVCLTLALPSHLTIVVLEVPEFWQLCLECCDGSPEGRVCMSGCVLSDGL